MSLQRTSRLLPVFQQTINPSRGYRHVVSGPPKVKVSVGEQIVHGAIMTVLALSIPTWVLINLKEYQGVKK